MIIKSKSELLQTASVKSAIAAHPRVEALAEKFDDAHLLVEGTASLANKQAKRDAKRKLETAVAELTVPA
jgi:hypothetical protein